MKTIIVTTTINKPTLAILKYIKIAASKNWQMIIVGDLKTPREAYQKLARRFQKTLFYLSPKEQEKKYKKLSDLIGFNCLQRRNFGFIEAFKLGAEIVATVDDDNIPYDSWGGNVVNKRASIFQVECQTEVFDPLSITNHNYLWHRGYPLQLLRQKNKVKRKSVEMMKVLVQANLWDGDPDIDAIARIAFGPKVKFNIKAYYAASKIAPFNTQNTFLSIKIFPDYFLFPGIGRMDDIWAAYLIQHKFPRSVIFGKATVYQERNQHNLIQDLEDEILGYKYSFQVATNPTAYRHYVPQKSQEAYEVYKSFF